MILCGEQELDIIKSEILEMLLNNSAKRNSNNNRNNNKNKRNKRDIERNQRIGNIYKHNQILEEYLKIMKEGTENKNSYYSWI